MNKQLMLVMISSGLALTACGKGAMVKSSIDSGAIAGLSPVGQAASDGVIVQARATFNYSTEAPSQIAQISNRLFGFALPSAMAASSGTQAVSVVLAPNTAMSLSNAGFVTPTMSNSILDFGTILMTSLQANSINVCGTGGKTHCGTALFRIYTSSSTGLGAGFYNAADAYGVPMTAGPQGGTLGSVGLDAAGATIAQTISVASSKHVVNLSDFGTAPLFNFKGDFSNAGAGTYAATIVVEFGVAN